MMRKVMTMMALTLLFCCVAVVMKQEKQEVTVNSIDALQKAVSAAKPGDVIVLASGEYKKRCTLKGKGTADQPIVVRAEEVGKVKFRNRLSISGDYITFIGGYFSGKGNVSIGGRGCRLSRCHMENVQTGQWVVAGSRSREIEIDHCLFEKKEINKKMQRGCQLLRIQVENKNERHHIHHNHFRDIPKGAGNGFETIQLITRRNPFNPTGGDCQTVIEDNLFERCNGEGEIISVKSSGNRIRQNTFIACKGSLVLRHGHRNIASENFFFADGERGAGGIRLQGTDQVVINNYFHGLGRFAVAMMDGTPDDLYVRVERARIEHNTAVNCQYGLLVGINHSKHPNGTVPKDCVIANNIFVVKKAADAEPEDAPAAVRFVQGDKPEGWTWRGNIFTGSLGVPAREGIGQQSPALTFRKDNVALPTAKTPTAKGTASGTKPVKSDIFGTVRGNNRTLGAIQFSDKNGGMGPLTKTDVGPFAVSGR